MCRQPMGGAEEEPLTGLANLLQPKNRVGFAIGVLGGPLWGGAFVVALLNRFGIITLPPLKAMSAIADAALEDVIENGSVAPFEAAGWVINLRVEMLSQYYAAESTTDFLQMFCGSHASWCEVAGVAATSL